MARRYSGAVTVDLLWDDRGFYKGRVSWPGGSYDATGLRLAPVDERRLAVDSPEAYDLASQGALAFASNEHEELYGHGLVDLDAAPGSSSWFVSRKPSGPRPGKASQQWADEARRQSRGNPTPDQIESHSTPEMKALEAKHRERAHNTFSSCYGLTHRSCGCAVADKWRQLAWPVYERITGNKRPNPSERDAWEAEMRRRFPSQFPRGKRPCLACGKLFIPDDDQQTACSRQCVRDYVRGKRAKGRIGFEKRNPTHSFGRDPFTRGEMARETAGSGTCDWCGQQRATLYRYGWRSDGGRYSGPAKGKFCNVQCFKSYHG